MHGLNVIIYGDKQIWVREEGNPRPIKALTLSVSDSAHSALFKSDEGMLWHRNMTTIDMTGLIGRGLIITI